MVLRSNEKVVFIVNDKPPKRQRLRVGDPDFVPPDGGWGWLIVFACGFSNLCLFAMFQQFGFVFRGKFEEIGITETQTTTITNLNSAFNAGMGLINGPLFRKYTYRQVAMFGSCIVASSLFICSFCESFVTYLIFYAMLYGCGIGITKSSNALALNTYFKQKRRIATGFSWTTTALGPIVWPHVVVALNAFYGMEGTVLLSAGFVLHSFACSLLLQPVEWHTNFRSDVPESMHLLEKPEFPHRNLESGKLSRKSSPCVFSSQYLRNADDPLLDRPLIDVSKRPSNNNLVHHGLEYKKRERKISQIKSAMREEIEESVNHNSKDETKAFHSPLTKEYFNEKEAQKSAAKKVAAYEQKNEENLQVEVPKQTELHISFLRKVFIFFDFDLFRDTTYVNLMLGITVANFAELNFSILTPIILKEFNFKQYETATFMSLLGLTDIVVRLIIPFVADRICWSNRVFFLIGVMTMAFGRIILVHTQTYNISLLVAVIIGAGKALRTIFMALVIPSYVPLERLAAASGLQMATSGLIFIILGPAVGWIREIVHNYVITLHILNICTYATAIAWMIESYCRRKTVEKQ